MGSWKDDLIAMFMPLVWASPAIVGGLIIWLIVEFSGCSAS